MEAGVVTAAKRDPVDVRKALRNARKLDGDETLAVELVRMAYDVDAATVMPFLDLLARIKDDTWRARTLFSVFQQTNGKLTGMLPFAAQDAIARVVEGISDEAARAAALRNLPDELPAPLRARLAGLAEALADPLDRLRTVVSYDKTPSAERAGSLLERAKGIEDEEKRGEALAIVAPVLDAALLAEAFAAAKSIGDAGVSGRALVRVVACISDAPARERAQLQILERAASIEEPMRRFDVLAALHELPTDRKRTTELVLFDLATKFDDPMVRCHAMFMTGGFADDEVLRTRAFVASIAAAEGVDDLQGRAELLALFRPVVAWLDPSVRSEVRRAVERLGDPEIQRQLRDELSRFFAYERPESGPRARDADPGAGLGARQAPAYRWDVFISYATADLAEARSLAFDLRSRGLQVFLAADNLDAEVGSAGWIAAIDGGIEAARTLLVLVTSDAMKSKWVAEEWGKYYRVMVDKQSGRLISLRLSGPPIAELPLTLRMHQILDSTAGRIEPAHLSRILDLVRGPSGPP